MYIHLYNWQPFVHVFSVCASYRINVHSVWNPKVNCCSILVIMPTVLPSQQNLISKFQEVWQRYSDTDRIIKRLLLSLLLEETNHEQNSDMFNCEWESSVSAAAARHSDCQSIDRSLGRLTPHFGLHLLDLKQSPSHWT